MSVDQAVAAVAMLLAGGLGLTYWNLALRRQVKRQEERLRYQAFHDALIDIRQVNGRTHLRPETAGVHPHDLHAHELRAVDADHAEYGSEQRHRDHPAQEPRYDHPLNGIDRHHFHRRYLIRGPHQTQF